MIAARQKAGPTAGVALSLVFAFLLMIVATADLFVVDKLAPQQPLPTSIRLPTVGLYTDTQTAGTGYRYVRMQFARGNRLSAEEQRLVESYEDRRRPPSHALLAGLGAGFFLILLLYTTHLRGLAPTGLFRTQFVLLLGLLLLAVGAKAYLTFTSWSAMWIPIAALIIPCASFLGARAAASTTIAGAMILGLLIPVDLPLLAVLCTQGFAAGLVAGKKKRRWVPLGAGLAAAVAGGVGFATISLLMQRFVPALDLLRQASPRLWLEADLAGSVGGGLLGGLLSWASRPLVGRMLGVVSKGGLLELANFESPLLRQLAHQAPGTWAHSLSMANMAEMAANAIGADAQLVRVGAYYHDLGKIAQPEYFIENQQGENPHDQLPPEVSADAIFSHITEGVKLARKHMLPEAVVEFIYTHHGDGLLEYFWHKNMQQGNPKGLEERDFRYPGCRPQTPETAILSLCDAVEAASRSITQPDMDKIRGLVRQIVFSKLEQGMLDASGLTIEDLDRVIASLIETLRSNLHVRVKYPWQRDDENKQGLGGDGRRAAEKTAAAGSDPTGPSRSSSEVIPLLAAKPRPDPGSPTSRNGRR